jgi:hypothetical protein
MDPGFLAGLAHMTSPPLTGVVKDVYPNLLGSLKFAAVFTRPDVSTALSILGSAQASHTDAHVQALKKVLRYLHGTIDMHLALRGGTDHNLQLTSFADADLANDNNTRKSRSGYLFTLGRGPISFKSKQHTCVAKSTCEAEYYSAADATKEELHLRLLNHANTVSVEDNSRKRSYSHSPANMTITVSTSLHAWCRDYRSM